MNLMSLLTGVDIGKVIYGLLILGCLLAIAFGIKWFNKDKWEKWVTQRKVVSEKRRQIKEEQRHQRAVSRANRREARRLARRKRLEDRRKQRAERRKSRKGLFGWL